MKRAMLILVIAGSLLTVAGCVEGGLFGPTHVPTATRGVAPLVKVRSGPAINGKIGGAWKKAPALVLGDVMSDEVGVLKTTAYVLVDSKNLYVAWECVEPDTKALIADSTERDGQVWNADSVELFISPDISKGYYQFAINANGVLMDAQRVAGDESDNSWDSGAKVKASIEKNTKWVVTMSVPLADLGVASGADVTWTMNLNRTKPDGDQVWIESSWSAKGRSAYHDSDGWGTMAAVTAK